MSTTRCPLPRTVRPAPRRTALAAPAPPVGLPPDSLLPSPAPAPASTTNRAPCGALQGATHA